LGNVLQHKGDKMKDEFVQNVNAYMKHHNISKVRVSKLLCELKGLPHNEGSRRNVSRILRGDVFAHQRNMRNIALVLALPPGDLAFMNPKDFEAKYCGGE